MIELIPVGNVDAQWMVNICEGIKEIFPRCELGIKKLEIPGGAYNQTRHQYDSTPILAVLMEYALSRKADKVLGVTTVDIYSQNMNFIFGQAFVGDHACLISTYQLDPRYSGGAENYRLFLERCVKEAAHELGHTYGLAHCDDRNCLMVFSNNISEVDRKTSKFCPKCTERLRGV